VAISALISPEVCSKLGGRMLPRQALRGHDPGAVQFKLAGLFALVHCAKMNDELFELFRP
jgi:hypothetical protein